MYPENNRPNRTRNIIIGIVVALLFLALFAGCIGVVRQFVRLGKSGRLKQWFAENGEEEGFGYYDDDGSFYYYEGGGGEEDSSGFGYYGEDGEFHYYGDEEDQFDYPTHEDNEGYEMGIYFSFPADNRKEGLSYSVEMEEEEYEDADSDYTDISYSYAVVEGSVPNVDKINEAIRDEWESLISFYEEAYKPQMTDRSDGILAELDCNVTYMSEEILSVVYQETIYYGETAGNAADYYIYCLNFDMKNGQLLENAGMLDIDEAFVTDFRERSDEQNGESVLEYYSDEELRGYFEDGAHLILFYCEQGMEIGLNVDAGWVTVTYADYGEFLKKI